MAESTTEVQLTETDTSEIPGIVARLRAGFRSYKTLGYDYRLKQLRNLKRMFQENEKKIMEALWKDLRKNETEAMLMEYNFSMGELVRTIDNLKDWMSPKYQPTDLLNKFNSVFIQPEPFGLVLIIAPWNYPFQLVVGPLIGAIAAGNTCLMKPSEMAINTSNLFMEMIPKYLDQECYAVVSGGVDVSKAVLKERYDYILYTGGTAVGKLVMKEAANHVTPVTLELGGKSPALVTKDANLDVAARRIIWGRCLNAGQTCISPDYVLCMRGQEQKLIDVCKKSLKEFFGETVKESLDFGRIINGRHFQRLRGLLQATEGTVECGGLDEADESSRFFPPTIVSNVKPEDKLMQEELFGPILPFVTVDSEDEAIEFINSREKPLAFYIFTESKATFERINRRTSSGGVGHNDVIMHSGIPTLPFGGVGYSGCGAYHGKFSFDTFTHYKAVLSTGTGLESLNKIRYPPNSPAKLKRLKWLLSPKEKGSGLPWRLLILFLLVAIAAVAVQMYGLPSWLYNLKNN